MDPELFFAGLEDLAAAACFAPAALELEKAALRLDSARRREAREPPPVLKAEESASPPPPPAAAARTIAPRPGRGGIAWKRRDEAAGRGATRAV